MKFKLRAECQIDISNFLQKAEESGYKIELAEGGKMEDGFPDAELTFSSNESAENLRLVADSVVDGHVMAQTLQPLEEYTGVRVYS